MAVAVFPDAADVRFGVTYGPTGADYTGSLVGTVDAAGVFHSTGVILADFSYVALGADCTAPNIATGKTIAGVAGSAVLKVAKTIVDADGVATGFTSFAAIAASKVVYADAAVILNASGVRSAKGILDAAGAVTATGYFGGTTVVAIGTDWTEANIILDKVIAGKTGSHVPVAITTVPVIPE